MDQTQQEPHEPDTPKAHWERFKAATRKAFATPQSELVAKLAEEKQSKVTPKKYTEESMRRASLPVKILLLLLLMMAGWFGTQWMYTITFISK